VARAGPGQGRQYRPGLPAGRVGAGQVTLVFQVPGEHDHRGVEPGEVLIPAGRRVAARLVADPQRAQRGGARRQDRDDRGEPPARPPVAPRGPGGGRAARHRGLGGEVGRRAEPAQGRGHLLITGTRPEGIVEVRDDLLPQLARLGGRQAAHGRIELGQVAADQPVIKRGAAH
jgi:hypothetical protein